MTEVNLKGQYVREIPPEVFQNVGIKSLVLDSNSLTSIPPEIGQFIHL